ncbi:MAG: hypothetical protein HOO97_02880 [Sideroxydans sp.]|nr:hypothetical protein [Sideroxydans sp.]
MNVVEQLSFCVLLVICRIAQADSADWNTSWDGTLYGYANAMTLRADSVLNPSNQIADIAKRTDAGEVRFNLKAESEDVRFTARPILAARNQYKTAGAVQKNEGYLSQWQMRVSVAEGVNVAAGREALNWGAAQFRSPSSPFYFDNGRSDPMRELVGMDTVKLTWTPDMQSSFTLARVVGAGRVAPAADEWRNTWLLKADQRGDGYAVGVVAAKAALNAAFYGAHGQYSVGDETLLYAEIGSSEQLAALQSPADVAQPFSVLPASPRRNTVLVGATYTLPDGQSLTAEYLRDNNGYTTAQEASYFSRAASSPLLAGQALAIAPRLLGRDYLHLVWQSNLMESEGYWRMMYTRSLTDGGGELGGYGETTLSTRISGFFAVAVTSGTPRQEVSSLFSRSVTLGVKVALH